MKKGALKTPLSLTRFFGAKLINYIDVSYNSIEKNRHW